MTGETRGKPRAAILLPIIAGACWGIAGIFVRGLAAAGLDNPTIVMTRTAMCAMLTFIYILLTDRGKLRMKWGDMPFVLAMGFFGSILLMVAYNVAALELSLSLAALLLNLAPVFVLLISALLFHERITGKKVICMVLAFGGCALLSGVFEGQSALQWTALGLLMGLASALCNAIYILMSKVLAGKGYSPFTVTFYMALFASIILIPFTDWSALTGYVVSDPAGSMTYLLVQSIVTSLLPGIVQIVAMRYIEAGKTAILQSGAEPSAALVAGIILFGEVPSAAGFAGLVITVIALMILVGDKS
ncbi:MAG: DMT family transporter [Firmicutes bacterium]|nr:DMT family transporter [Bacillota bacterium]